MVPARRTAAWDPEGAAARRGRKGDMLMRADGVGRAMAAPAPRYPVWDNHFHLDPAGPWEQAVQDFLRSGGTHVMLVHKPYHEGDRVNRSVADHERQFAITLEMAERARALGLRVAV